MDDFIMAQLQEPMIKAIPPPTPAAETPKSDFITSAPLQQAQPQTQARPLPSQLPRSPVRHPYPSAIAASPSRLRSSSPRTHSPASSEIFERNVQEPVPISTLHSDDTAHIPSHVMTEDHIPPALEASAQAITSNSLNADEVEIVMSASHQPAAASVLDGSFTDNSQLHSPTTTLSRQTSEPDALQQSGFLPVLPAPEDENTQAGTSYGQLDPNDVRRLSFISFADVVQSEHAQQHHHHASASSLHQELSRDSLLSQSPPLDGSPHLRSPTSPRSLTDSHAGLRTPPPGVAVFPAVPDAGSPGRAPVHGELTIETMRQAVRKTASGDLGIHRAAMSPIVVAAGEDSTRQPRSRTATELS